MYSLVAISLVILNLLKSLDGYVDSSNASQKVGIVKLPFLCISQRASSNLYLLYNNTYGFSINNPFNSIYLLSPRRINFMTSQTDTGLLRPNLPISATFTLFIIHLESVKEVELSSPSSPIP